VRRRWEDRTCIQASQQPEGGRTGQRRVRSLAHQSLKKPRSIPQGAGDGKAAHESKDERPCVDTEPLRASYQLVAYWAERHGDADEGQAAAGNGSAELKPGEEERGFYAPDDISSLEPGRLNEGQRRWWFS